MSFLSVLGKIGKVALSIDKTAAPLISMVPLPGFAIAGKAMTGIAGIFQDHIVAAEQTTSSDPTKPVSGLEKLVMSGEGIVNELFDAAHTLGFSNVTYDKALLDAAISSQVKAYNDIMAFKATVKVGGPASPPAN